MANSTGRKVFSACLRVLEFCGSAIILGLLARFFYIVDQLDGPTDSRLIFAISMAAISVFFAMVLVVPLKYSFYCFPIDFALFICWITCYALLQDLSGTSACSSPWFQSYWTVYWNGSSSASVITSPGCSQWRVVLGFSFIVAFIWITSGFVGLYSCIAYHNLGEHTVAGARKLKFWKKKQPKTDLENGHGTTGHGTTGNGTTGNGNGAESPNNLLPKVG